MESFSVIKNPCSVSTILLQFFVFLLFCNAEAKNGTISAVVAFGDSILDTGNNNNLMTYSKCNFPPYGKDFPGGIATGRFSNGKVFSDLVAEGLGVKAILPAYLDPNLQDQDLPTGVNFASGGSGLDPMTARAQSVLSMTDQLNLFKGYISRLKRFVGEDKTYETISTTLCLISSGNNDFGFSYMARQYDIFSYTSQLVSWASNFVKDLYELGARRIGFMGTLPFGCLPIVRAYRAGLLGACAEDINGVAQMFNSKLSSELNLLNRSLANATVFYIDVYSPLLALVQNPQQSGFVVTNNGCFGTGGMYFTCSDISDYVFWDSVHPTEKAYRIIVSQILQKYANYFS